MRTISHAGVLPYRLEHGGPKFLLITTRRSKRWIVPKGQLEENSTAGEIALREANEEAGLTGQLDPEPLGTFSHAKNGSPVADLIVVFPLHVAGQSNHWPEKEEREWRWFTASEAVELVEPDLGRLILSFAQRFDQGA